MLPPLAALGPLVVVLFSGTSSAKVASKAKMFFSFLALDLVFLTEVASIKVSVSLTKTSLLDHLSSLPALAARTGLDDNDSFCNFNSSKYSAKDLTAGCSSTSSAPSSNSAVASASPSA